MTTVVVVVSDSGRHPGLGRWATVCEYVSCETGTNFWPYAKLCSLMGYFTSIVGALLAASAVNAIAINPRSSLLTANSPVPLYSDAAPAQVRASRRPGAWLHTHYIS